MGRPTGLNVLAVLMILWAGVLVGLVLLVGDRSMRADSTGGGLPPMLAEIGATGSTFLLVLAGLYAVLAIGLLKLLNLARIGTIILVGLGLLSAAAGVVASVAPFRGSALLGQLIVVGVDGWIIWYLLQPHVKHAFREKLRGAASNP